MRMKVSAFCWDILRLFSRSYSGGLVLGGLPFLWAFLKIVQVGLLDDQASSNLIPIRKDEHWQAYAHSKPYGVVY